MTARASPRLRPDDWLAAGLSALAEGGPGALAAEPLARRLGATKGSFYWHFDDLPAFHAAVLARWTDDLRAQVSGVLAETDGTVAQLRRLAQHLARRTEAADLDRAVRAWAVSHPGAAAAVARTDAECAAHLRGLLADLGIGNPEMTRLIQATGVGMAAMADIAPGDAARAMGSLVDLVLALR